MFCPATILRLRRQREGRTGVSVNRCYPIRMNKVIVVSRPTVEKMLIQQFYGSAVAMLQQYNIISCLDSGFGSPFMKSVYAGYPGSGLLTLHFDDVFNDLGFTHGEQDSGIPDVQYAVFTYEQAQRIIRWLTVVDHSKQFLVHCFAGNSRSGAVGVWLSRYLGNTDEQFYAANPQCVPNPDILETLMQAQRISAAVAATYIHEDNRRVK